MSRHTHTHTHTYVRTYTHTHTYIYTYVCTKKWKNRSDVNTRKKSRQLLEDLNETRGYWTLKEEVLERTLWRTRFGGGYGPVVGQTANERIHTHTYVCILTLMNVKINSRYDCSTSAQEISWQLWMFSGVKLLRMGVVTSRHDLCH